MPTLILAGVFGLCIGLVVLAFVLVVLDNRRLAIGLAEARADVTRLKAERNAALDGKRAAEANGADLAHQLATAQAEARERDARLAALERVDRNPLYREALEDQRARQLRAADDVSTGVEFMLQAIRTLAPEMLKKGKR